MYSPKGSLRWGASTGPPYLFSSILGLELSFVPTWNLVLQAQCGDR